MQLMPDEEIKRIAQGLTVAQRGFVIDKPASCVDSYKPLVRAEALGLAERRPGYSCHLTWTPLGLAVRDYLMKEGADGHVR